LRGVSPPRISGDIKNTLQLSKQCKLGDWYLYQNFTEFKIYGCEFSPFKLPKYVPMQLFALEYYRKMCNANLIHFTKANKKAQLRIKHQIGPFVCNSREAREAAEIILEDYLRLQNSFGWTS